MIRLLKVNGWELGRINGSHHIMIKGNKTVTVPVHSNRSLGKVLEQKIMRQAGVKR